MHVCSLTRRVGHPRACLARAAATKSIISSPFPPCLFFALCSSRPLPSFSLFVPLHFASPPTLFCLDMARVFVLFALFTDPLSELTKPKHPKSYRPTDRVKCISNSCSSGTTTRNPLQQGVQWNGPRRIAIFARFDRDLAERTNERMRAMKEARGSGRSRCPAVAVLGG